MIFSEDVGKGGENQAVESKKGNQRELIALFTGIFYYTSIPLCNS